MRNPREVGRLRNRLRIAIEVNPIGCEGSVRIDLSLLFEQRGRMNENLAGAFEQTRFARRDGNVDGRKRVFVINVIADQIRGEKIQGLGKVRAPKVQDNFLAPARDEDVAGLH